MLPVFNIKFSLRSTMCFVQILVVNLPACFAMNYNRFEISTRLVGDPGGGGGVPG